MDELYKKFINLFPNINEFEEYKSIINTLSNSSLIDYPNLLLYSCKGFPIDLLIQMCLNTRFKQKIVSKECTWGQGKTPAIFYYENPYYFTIDMNNPNQSKDLTTISSFFKDIIGHPCVHAESGRRHIFIIYNIDKICNKENVYAFRVLLERFSNNVIFINTTYSISKIEQPLCSRMLCIRIPLFSKTRLNTFITNLGFAENEYDGNDIYMCLLFSWLKSKNVATNNFNIPAVEELSSSSTLEHIRNLSQKIYVNDISFSMLIFDLLKIIPNDEKKQILISQATNIEHLLAKTEGHRMSIYIEYVLLFAIKLL